MLLDCQTIRSVYCILNCLKLSLTLSQAGGKNSIGVKWAGYFFFAIFIDHQNLAF